MPNLEVKPYHSCVYTGKNVVYVEFGTISDFRHPMGGLERVPMDKGHNYTNKSLIGLSFVFHQLISQV